MKYLAKVRLLCDKRQTLIIKYANIMGGKKRSNSMQTTYPCIKTNRGRHHDIPGHTKTKIKLMVSNLSYAAACSSLDLHCKGRALRPPLQSPTLGIFRAAPVPPVGSDPNGKNIRPHGRWHQMLPAVAYDPAGHSTVCHGDGIAPHGKVASCSIPRGEVTWDGTLQHKKRASYVKIFANIYTYVYICPRLKHTYYINTPMDTSKANI